MDKHESAVSRGEEAQRLLASEIFAQAFADTRQALLNTWAQLDTTDGRYAELAHDIHRKVKCLDSVKRCIEAHVSTGKLANKEIEGRSRSGFADMARRAMHLS